MLHRSGFYAVRLTSLPHVSVGHLVLPTDPGNVPETPPAELLEFAQLSSVAAPAFTAVQ